jgi:uncharacterized membrane protein
MASAASSRWNRLPPILFWAVTCSAAAYFALSAILEIVGREPGTVPGWRAALLAVHAAAALPLLAIAPFQFSTALRSRLPRVHRWLGRLFLSLAILAAVSAIALGVTIGMPGIRISLTLLGATVLFCAIAAWLCARAGDFAAHRKFAIRTFALAFAFVWIRMAGATADTTLAFIEDAEHRAINLEWMTLAVPLLITESWLTWLPALRGALRKQRRARGGES